MDINFKGIFTINYIELIPLLLKNIQELELQLQEQKEYNHLCDVRNLELQTSHEVHENRINELHALVNKLMHMMQPQE